MVDVASISTEGRWTPMSRAYEGSPGKFIISKGTILFDNCKQPFTVVRDKTREDNLWNGTDNSPNVKRYRDISIKVRPNPKCESIPDQVFRFLITEDSPCAAILMLYTSEKNLQSDHWGAWGGYVNETCIVRGTKTP